MPQPRNFVLLYSGREGSSAIVSALGNQPGVHIPLFEHLDRYQLEGRRSSELPAILDEVLSSGRYEPAGVEPPSDRSAVGIGFKWRPFGPARRIAPVLARHRVVAFVLSRRNFREYVSSLYFTRYANRLQAEREVPEHPQFGALGMSPTEREAYFAELSKIRIPARPHLLAATMARIVYRKWRMAGFAAALHAAGVPVRPVYYEDFAADNAGFVGEMAAQIGVPAGQFDAQAGDYRKVLRGAAVDRLGGLSRAFPRAGGPLAERLYRRQLRRIDRIGR